VGKWPRIRANPLNLSNPKMHRSTCENQMNNDSPTYTVGGGKGGTGKSFITASLGTILAQQGKKVLLVDLDLGASNLHTFLALGKPKISLKRYLNREVYDINDVVIQTNQPNLSVISSAGCSLEIANLYYAQKVKLIRAIKKLSYDYLFIDLGSGTHYNTLDFYLISNEGIIVTTPEPISVENMFRFLKSIYLRKVKAVLKQYGLNIICREYLNRVKDSPVKSFSHIMDFVKEYDAKNNATIEKCIKDQKIGLILNQFRWQVDKNFGHELTKICSKHLYFNYHFLGNVSSDHKIGDATMKNRVYVNEYGYAKTAKEICNIAMAIIDETCEPELSLPLVS
jgi:flagellar biosynthesis protein FlhG